MVARSCEPASQAACEPSPPPDGSVGTPDQSIFWYQGQAWYRHVVGGQVLYVSPTRIYVPEDGRFLERDPVGWMVEEDGDVGPEWGYGYWGVNWVDPGGLAKVKVNKGQSISNPTPKGAIFGAAPVYGQGWVVPIAKNEKVTQRVKGGKCECVLDSIELTFHYYKTTPPPGLAYVQVKDKCIGVVPIEWIGIAIPPEWGGFLVSSDAVRFHEEEHIKRHKKNVAAFLKGLRAGEIIYATTPAPCPAGYCNAAIKKLLSTSRKPRLEHLVGLGGLLQQQDLTHNIIRQLKPWKTPKDQEKVTKALEDPAKLSKLLQAMTAKMMAPPKKAPPKKAPPPK